MLPNDSVVRGPVTVISPHLDDAVLGCGELLATQTGSLVITLFAGIPAEAPVTPWDASCGFASGPHAMRARIEEDRRAMGVLPARSIKLDFLDAQYAPSPAVEDVAAALSLALREAESREVLVPWGLFHEDHELTFDAACQVIQKQCRYRWLAYEEPTYAHIDGLMATRLASLPCRGLSARFIGESDRRAVADKEAALLEYRSQFRAFAACDIPVLERALKPERYWQLSPRLGWK